MAGAARTSILVDFCHPRSVNGSPSRGIACHCGEPRRTAPMYGPRELTHPRDEIVRTMERIYRYRMTTTSGGNLSIRDDDGSVWITPARVDKGSLNREDVVRVRSDG